MAEALDARRAEGWPDSSEASAALAAGIATLDGRISKTLAERDEADRKAERDRIPQRTALTEESIADSRKVQTGAKAALAVVRPSRGKDSRTKGQKDCASGIFSEEGATFRPWVVILFVTSGLQ